MPQPFPKDDFTYSHKFLPPSIFPLHANDFRYNYKIQNLPRRHFSPAFQLRLYNFSDFDSIMHGLQWADFEPDYQLADPMESNHYIQGRSPSFVVFMAVGIFIFAISKICII